MPAPLGMSPAGLYPAGHAGAASVIVATPAVHVPETLAQPPATMVVWAAASPLMFVPPESCEMVPSLKMSPLVPTLAPP